MFVEFLVEQTLVDGSLEGGLDDTHRDDFLHSTIAVLIELFGEIHTFLGSVLKPEEHESFQAFGLVVGHLEVSDRMDVLKRDVPVLVNNVVVPDQLFVVEMVLNLFSE